MVLKFYFNKTCPYSIRINIILEEKKIPFESIDISDFNIQDIKKLSVTPPFPVLVEKYFIAKKNNFTIFYIDERFISPNLLPNQNESKFIIKMINSYIEETLFYLYDKYKVNKIKQNQINILNKIINFIKTIDKEYLYNTKYINSNEFTLADCSFIAILIFIEQKGCNIHSISPSISKYYQNMKKKTSIQKTIFYLL